MISIFKRYVSKSRLFLFAIESVTVIGCVYLGIFLRYIFDTEIAKTIALNHGKLVPKVLFILFVCQGCLYFNDLYDTEVIKSRRELVIRLLQSLGACCLVLAGFYYIFPSLYIGRGIFVISVFIIVALIVTWRLLYSRILQSGRFFDRIQKRNTLA